jgi:hypothetical protein
MKYIRPLLSLSLLAIAIVGSACNQTSSVKYDGGFDEATITISPTAYSFPNTALGESSPAAKFTLTNIGLEPTGPVAHVLEGVDFTITASTCGQPLPYNGTCDVSVVFKPIAAGQRPGRLTASATPGKSFTVLLSGTSEAASSARLQPTVWDFAPVSIPTPSNPTPMATLGMFTVTNSGGTPVGPLSAIVEGGDADSFALSDDACTGAFLQAGQSCAMTVRFKPITAGTKNALLTVTGNNVKLPSATLSGTGSEPAKLTVTPLMQAFGDVPVGMKSAYTFEVRNDGAEPSGKISYALEGISISEFAVAADATCDMALRPTDSCGVTVTFSPTLQGKKQASLRISASPGGFARVDLQANAITASILGQISVTSPSPDPFGTVILGESSSGFFIVENKGTVAAGKVMPTISGSSSSEFVIQDNSCPDKLDPGQQCGITVRFTPVTATRRTANLQVTALPGGYAILPLSGNALAGAQLRISPQSRSFSDRVIGSTSNIQTQSFTITNTGTGMTGPLAVTIESTDQTHISSFELFGLNDCTNLPLLQGRTCRVDVRFLPKIRGFLNAYITIAATPGGTVRATMSGRGCQGSVSNANCQ